MSLSRQSRQLTPSSTVGRNRHSDFRSISLASSYMSPNISAGSFHGPSGLTDSDDEVDSPRFSFLAPSGYTGNAHALSQLAYYHLLYNLDRSTSVHPHLMHIKSEPLTPNRQVTGMSCCAPLPAPVSAYLFTQACRTFADCIPIHPGL